MGQRIATRDFGSDTCISIRRDFPELYRRLIAAMEATMNGFEIVAVAEGNADGSEIS